MYHERPENMLLFVTYKFADMIYKVLLQVQFNCYQAKRWGLYAFQFIWQICVYFIYDHLSKFLADDIWFMFYLAPRWHERWFELDLIHTWKPNVTMPPLRSVKMYIVFNLVLNLGACALKMCKLGTRSRFDQHSYFELRRCIGIW